MKQQDGLKVLRKGEIQGPYELPEGWRWESLREVFTSVKSGFACSKKYETKEGVPHLRPNNVGFSGELDLSKLVHIPKEMFDSRKYSLRKADVLFNNTNSKELVGRACLVKEDLNYGFSNHITRLRIKTNLITPEWLVLSINYLWFQGYFIELCQKWIGQAGINKTMLKSIQIPLPPFEEQKRVVVRIEKLFGKLDEIKRVRKETNEKAKALLPSALHEVFSKAGEEGWNETELGKLLCEIKTGKTPPSKQREYFDGIINWFTPIDLGEQKMLSKSNRTLTGRAIDENKATLFKKNTLLFVGIGATLGKVGITKSEASANQQITGLLFKKDILTDYAYYWFRYNEKDIRNNSPSVTLPILNQEGIKSLKIPIPSKDNKPDLEEQKGIFSYLDKIQEKATILQKLQDETEEKINKLRASILNMAFRGEL